MFCRDGKRFHAVHCPGLKNIVSRLGNSTITEVNIHLILASAALPSPIKATLQWVGWGRMPDVLANKNIYASISLWSCSPVQALLEETIPIFVSYLNMCKGSLLLRGNRTSTTDSKIIRTPGALLFIGETFLRQLCWPSVFSQIWSLSFLWNTKFYTPDKF